MMGVSLCDNQVNDAGVTYIIDKSIAILTRSISILHLVCCYLLLKLISCTDYTEMFFVKLNFPNFIFLPFIRWINTQSSTY
jgi:hypothetical protein